MNILIVDDEPLARERLRQMLKRKEADIDTVSEAANGAEALEALRSGQPDVVFLDVQMPDMTGFHVLESLGQKRVAEIPALVFVTAYEQHALRAFEHHAIDYLLKPFDRDRFTDTFARIKKRVSNKTATNSKLIELLDDLRPEPKYLEWITVKKDERILLLKVDDVHWIEANGNYVLLKLKDGSQMLRDTINHIESQLDPAIFIRIHRSTIVNVNQIKELQVWARGEYRVMMKAGPGFTLSRGYRDRFDSFLKKHALQS